MAALEDEEADLSVYLREQAPWPVQLRVLDWQDAREGKQEGRMPLRGLWVEFEEEAKGKREAVSAIAAKPEVDSSSGASEG